MPRGIGKKGLADVVFERLQRAIKSGAYAADERLPTENELAAEFEVSRPIVREALRRLREQGLILSRKGAGSFVRTSGLRQPLGFGQLENLSDLINCYEFRLALEPEIAACAAERHTDTALSEINAALDLMRDATKRQLHRENADFQFHLAIARAAGNTYFTTALEALKDHIAVGMRFHGASVKRDAHGLENVLAEHARIYQAIRDRDAPAARDVMRRHIAGSRGRLTETRDPDTTA